MCTIYIHTATVKIIINKAKINNYNVLASSFNTKINLSKQSQGGLSKTIVYSHVRADISLIPKCLGMKLVQTCTYIYYLSIDNYL